MNKPKLLDLYCCAGGAAKGYQMAGFHVTGIDKDHQPRYAGNVFVQADALEYVAEYGHLYDAVHASPPCQGYSEATPMQYRGRHPDLIAPTRTALQATGKPYVIENVENARRLLINPIKLCGSMFGLPIWRHRYFEIWPEQLWLTPSCNHSKAPITINSGSHSRKLQRVPVLCSGGGDGQRQSRKNHRPRETVEVVRWAMQIDWMIQDELTEALPPVYTKWIGHTLMLLLANTDIAWCVECNLPADICRCEGAIARRR